MTLHLPLALSTPDDRQAVELLRRYYGSSAGGRRAYTGSAWDTWDSTGTRVADSDRFTADDVASLSLLGVDVPGNAVLALLHENAAQFSEMLRAVGPDRDLAAEEEPISDVWPGSVLYRSVDDITGLGRTKVSKLLARKRPRLFPIRDSVVERVIGVGFLFWEPLRQLLRESELQSRLERLGQEAELPKAVTALRVFDVICWMEGTASP